MSYEFWRKRLPQRSLALRRATTFNQETVREVEQFLKSHQRELSALILNDFKPDHLPRNYHDYIISIGLELMGEMERFRPLPLNEFLNSKRMLLHYRDELERTPPNRRIKRVGVFDTETTDITGYIVSYAFVIEKWPEQEVELEEYQLLNPEASISEESQEIHKIKAEELENKPTFREIKDHFLGLFKKVDMVVGHNVFFDMGVVKRELERLSHFPPIVEKPIFDTMFFSADLVTLDKKKMPRLEEVAEQLLGQRGGVTYHNALEDVKVTLRVFNYLLTASIK